MNADKPPSTKRSVAGEKKRDELLSELESIHHLLSENDSEKTSADTTNTHKPNRIPVLMPDDSIPTLGPEHRHHDARAQQARKVPARISAKHPPATVLLSTTRSREDLVDDVVRSAMPRIESLLRELVQEALLQEKLRGKKR